MSPGSAAARRRRARAAETYRPKRVRLLLVAEAPPDDLERYFYFDDVREQDSLFRYVAAGILGIAPTRESKSRILRALKKRGVFLIDLSEDPIGTREPRQFVDGLVDRAREIRAERIILIKVNVYDVAFAALRAEGLPVVDERIPFPSTGNQKKFEEGFARAHAADEPA